MRTTHATARWGLLALLALVVSVGCHDTDSLLVDNDERPEEFPEVTRKVHIPEHWAKSWAKVDHCALEERNFRETGYKLPPWESYCHNPRPLETGTHTRESMTALNRELKREWEERHRLTPLGAKSK